MSSQQEEREKKMQSRAPGKEKWRHLPKKRVVPKQENYKKWENKINANKQKTNQQEQQEKEKQYVIE